MKKLVVLISCMYEKDYGIINRLNVQTDAVIINQCDVESVEKISFFNKKGNACSVSFVNTKERGLSKSRNMAIKLAEGDIGLICDDDEYLDDDYEAIILNAYKKNKSQIIAFSIIRKDCIKAYPLREGSLSFRQILSTSSPQITFNLRIIKEKQIFFDEKMGSGTGNGGGEENKFQMDCLRNGLKMYYYPINIATIEPNEKGSKWFNGYDLRYFENRGWTARRIFGTPISLLYIVYITYSMRVLYKDRYSLVKVIKHMLKGWCDKR